MTRCESNRLCNALWQFGAEALMRADALVNQVESVKALSHEVAEDLEDQFRAYDVWLRTDG